MKFDTQWPPVSFRQDIDHKAAQDEPKTPFGGFKHSGIGKGSGSRYRKGFPRHHNTRKIDTMKKKWRLLSESENYKGGKFRNLSATPVMAEGASFRKILYDNFHRPASVVPPQPLPSVKTDLKSMYSEEPVIVWFGHSSYLIHCKGTNILVDPVFSGHASPFRGMVKAFPGSDVYKAEDMPAIDILILTHNHYDHLDKNTITRLSPGTRAFYVPLGVGKSVAGCGVNDLPITEMDWWETAKPMPGIELTATPARHFSGRGLRRAGSLWSSFVLKMYGYSIFIGGDSGYDRHFRLIGEKFGPFDIATLECGQYNEAWPYIHMMPEQTAQAAIDLKAKVLMPVHWGKFTLSNHPWNESIKRLTKAAGELDITVTTPLIGEFVIIDQHYPHQNWWSF